LLLILLLLLLVLLGHIAALARCGLLFQTEWRGLSVGLSQIPAKMAELSEMPFGLRTGVDHVLYEVQIPPWEGAVLMVEVAAHRKI